MVKPKLLFHSCCAPCSGLLSQQLQENFDLAIYFDNPNIWPAEEFNQRLKTARNFFESQGVDFIATPWDHEAWLEITSGLEQEPERGRRCLLCYHYRLDRAAAFASQNNFDYFTTSLSVSPYKNQQAIISLGRALAKKHGVQFLADDFRQDENFKKSDDFAKRRGFYRQKYCGCEFSRKGGKI